jgi:uncharacterized protein with von Willebrand factor type A (vWA) domain
MGGTDIFEPLCKYIYSKENGIAGDVTLNAFLLTDGEAEAHQVLDLVKEYNKAETRIYSLGIGEDCN